MYSLSVAYIIEGNEVFDMICYHSKIKVQKKTPSESVTALLP